MKILSNINRIIMAIFLLGIAIILTVGFLNQNNIHNDLIIALVSALIGGFLTLVGVKTTLLFQENKKFIDEAPMRIYNINQLIGICGTLNSEINKKNYKVIPKTIDEMMLISSRINNNVMSLVIDLQENAFDYYNTYLNLDENGISEKEIETKLIKNLEVMHKKLQETSDRLMQVYLSKSRKE